MRHGRRRGYGVGRVGRSAAAGAYGADDVAGTAERPRGPILRMCSYAPLPTASTCAVIGRCGLAGVDGRGRCEAGPPSYAAPWRPERRRVLLV